MNKNLLYKSLLIVAVFLFFLFGIFRIPTSFSGQGLLSAMTDHIHLGLDLRGGTHLILQVQVNDAVKVDSDNAIEVLKEQLNKSKIAFSDISKPDPDNNPDHIAIRGVPVASRTDLLNIVRDRLPEYDVASGANDSWNLAMKPQMLSELKSKAVTQAIETIRNRVDSLGVSEPTIQEHGLGQYQILMQLPGVDDPGRVKGIVQDTAMLEIKLVMGGPYSSEQAALQDKGGILPSDTMLVPGKLTSGPQGEGQQWYLLSRVSAVTGKDLRDSRPTTDQNGLPAVGFNLTAEGGRKFYKFTSDHVKEPLAVVLDTKVQSVATIDEPIGDSGIIKGRFTEQEVNDQCMVLRSGALPASVKYLEERTVGPSLGNDSIHAGVRASVIGMIAVLVFMLVYYRAAGINANVALILNLVLLLGFMGYVGATLTLPGIAGVILTVGMGVDTNVLIFERIREELRNGKTPPSAVDQGFSHAWITIVDTHVTTIITAFILMFAGKGTPVYGFSVTLIVGLAANLFTAVFVSRVIFDFLLSRKQRGEALSI
jgi:preprotein translocase subunit SecD